MIAALAALFVVCLPAFFARPAIAYALTVSGAKRSMPITTISLLTGPVIFLLFFSLWGRVLPGYGWSLAAALLTLGTASFLLSKRRVGYLVSNDRPFLMSFLALFCIAYFLRTHWPALHWENSVQRLGVERLFNLSLQQSFLYSENWPPNNIWLHGEPVQYHLLLRAAPGIASWLARVVFGSPLMGGALYLIFDALYLTLAPLAVAAWGFVLMSTLASRSDGISKIAERRCVIVSLLVGALTFFAPHGAALLAGLSALWSGTTVDFWMIQHEVVKGTVNFFPFGLLLSGESHSYAQAPFLQVCLWGSVMWQLCTPFSTVRALLTGMLASALAMAHPASALLAASGLSLAVGVVLASCFRSEGKESFLRTAGSLGISAACAALLYLPSYLTLNPPQTRWVWVTDELTSPAVPFLTAQAAPLVITAIFLLVGLQFQGFIAAVKKNFATIFSVGFLVVIAAALSRPAIGITILLFSLIGLSGRRAGVSESNRAAAFAIGVAIAWLLPEIVVSDWAIDNRTDWVRFNTVMRFWLDGYYLVPLLAVVLSGLPALESVARYRTLCWSLCTALLVSVFSLYPLLRNRLERTPELKSSDGFAFLSKENAVDWWIVDYLARLPGQVVLGETCGTGTSPLVPYHYGMPGRLSAFSGRPSVCGWARHTWMFQPVFTKGAKRGENIWPSFLAYEQALGTIYTSNSQPELQRAVTSLIDRGVTHLAFGELEGRVFGNVDLRRVAERIHGTVVLNPKHGYGVIALVVGSSL
jgi:hypothetical protein